MSGQLDRLVADQEEKKQRKGRSSSRRDLPTSSRWDDSAKALHQESPGTGYRTGPDMDRLPNGYDPDVWTLTLEFIAEAEKYGVELDISSYRTYALLLRRLGRTKLRDRKNWMEIVSKMIAEFWENDVEVSGEAWAITQFTGVETFTGLAKWAIRMLAPEPEVVAVHDGTRPESEGAAKRKAAAQRRKQARDRLNAVDLQDPESINAFVAEARARREAIMRELSE